MNLRLTFLGTSAAMPTLSRNPTATALLRGGELLLFDVGEGTQRALLQAGLGLNRRTKIFITHLHGDHVLGLPGLLQSMAMVGRERPLHLYGPPDLKGFVETNLEYLRLEPPYPLQVTTIEGDGPIRVVDEPGYRVWAHPNHHSAPGFAYLLEEKPRPGVFNPQRARELGVPEGPLWHFLQHGKPVKVGGRLVKPEEVVGPRRRGRRVGFSGDTRPIEALAEFFKGCDVLVYDSTYGEAHRDKALEYLHSTAREAGELAFRAGVRLLVLTHFSTRYDDPEVLVAEARQVHPNVIAAHELLSIDVPYPE